MNTRHPNIGFVTAIINAKIRDEHKDYLRNCLEHAKANMYSLMNKDNVTVFPADAGPADRVTIKYSRQLKDAMRQVNEITDAIAYLNKRSN